MPAPTPKRPTTIAALAAAVVLSAGCGPFGYLKKVAVDASRAVADAEKAGAQQYAPYEYWGAVTYLEQSKVLMAYSEYDRSFDYGDRAKQLAEEAKKKAQLREAGKMRTTIDDKKLEEEKKAAGSATSSGKAGEGKVDGKAGGSVGGGTR
ncbi:MAG TPA: DUF4398 domain-containing protein [Nannocystaceae bacterium]|nr:DUF4398 domain-containing protein [Nannocystaceae bacterium]